MPGAEYDRDPRRIEFQARLIASTPALRAHRPRAAGPGRRGPRRRAAGAARSWRRKAAAIERFLAEVPRRRTAPKRLRPPRRGRRRSAQWRRGHRRLNRRACAPTPPSRSTWPTTGRPLYLIDEVHLDFALAPNATRVKAQAGGPPQRRRTTRPLRLNGERLKPISVAIDGRALAPAEYEIDDEFLTIAGAPAAFTLETEVEIDPEGNTALEGLYMSAGRFCTQCEAEGFRKITWFPDRPDVLSRFTVRIEADRRPTRACSPTAT